MDTLADLAIRGEDLARSENSNGAYTRFQRDQETQRTTLKVLRECLEFHQSWHKC